jgi:hypothetical protein
VPEVLRGRGRLPRLREPRRRGPAVYLRRIARKLVRNLGAPHAAGGPGL